MDEHAKVPVGFMKHLVLSVALSVLTVCAFEPVLSNGFVNWDDEPNFLTNKHYRGLGASQITWALSTYHLGAYQPLGWLLYSSEYHIWGLDPRGYHFISIAVHVGNAILLYALICRFMKILGVTDHARNPELWAGMAVALYAIHPMRVEPVAWISCQSYLPCALLMLVTVFIYASKLKANSSFPADWSGGMLLSYTLALLFKAQAITIPVILVILDCYLVARAGGDPRTWFGWLSRRAILNRLPFFGLAIIFAVVAYRAKATTFHGAPVPARGPLADIAVICYGFWYYVFKTLMPLDIAAIHTVPGPLTWTSPRLAIAVLAVGGASVAAFLGRKRLPGLLAMWVISLVLLSPTPGLLSLSLQFVANRYTYVAAMGWAIAVAVGLNQLVAACKGRGFPIAMLALGLAAIGWLVVQTRATCRTWHDSESLWTYALNHGAGTSAVAYSNLAGVYRDRRQLDRAIAVYRSALSQGLDQNDVTGLADLHFNLGRCLEAQGKLDEAATHLAEVARIAQSANANYHCGRVLSAAGRFEEAILYFNRSLRINPHHVSARQALGRALRAPKPASPRGSPATEVAESPDR